MVTRTVCFKTGLAEQRALAGTQEKRSLWPLEEGVGDSGHKERCREVMQGED